MKREKQRVQVSRSTIDALVSVITSGSIDSELEGPYRTGGQLVDFFREFGFRDAYQGSGFPSRSYYTKEKLELMNAAKRIGEAIEAAVDPRHFLTCELPVEDAVAHLNRFLELDGWQLVRVGKRYRLRPAADKPVEIGSLFTATDKVDQLFIEEQIAKCDRKLDESDFDGAITNARSLVEAVLVAIEERLCEDPEAYDGNLSKLYKRVYRLMNLDPRQASATNAMREILGGLVSAVSGLASLRNKMSDSHAREYRPSKHHAMLAVNAAKTLVRFFTDSLEYQAERGTISLHAHSERAEEAAPQGTP